MSASGFPDHLLRYKGFNVEIEAPDGGTDVDASWESVSGGEKFVTTSPGHKSVGEITLRGAMTGSREGIEAWINEIAAGKTSTRTVSITGFDEQGKPGPTYRFIDCVLSAYRPPLLRRHACDVMLREEVRFIYRDWIVLG